MKTNYIEIETNEAGKLIMEDLPYNCIFNKVVTGCGGTTIALVNDENYVIAVPTTELVINKTQSLEAGLSKVTIIGKEVEIFGWFGKRDIHNTKEFEDYTKTKGVKKIICTYDKLPYITEVIKTSEYRLLVDEYHKLLRDYAYRSNAIDGVLNSFRAYKSFCFMSATPIQSEYKPDVLEGIDEFTANWGDRVERVKIQLLPRKNPILAAAEIASTYLEKGYVELNGIKSDCAYFFVNSTTDIKKILDYCNAPIDKVRIVCNDKNKEKLTPYIIGSSKDETKMLNFLTCKAFEGADFYGENAISYVVSSTRNPYTLVSIDTELPQIAGRVRNQNNEFRKRIIHVTNYNFYTEEDKLTYEEVVGKINKRLEEDREYLKIIDSVSGELRERMIEDCKNSINKHYLTYKDGKLYINDIKVKLDLYDYKVRKFIYNSANLTKAYLENNILLDVQYKYIDNEEVNPLIAKKIDKKSSFKDLYLTAIQNKKDGNFIANHYLFEKEPLLKEAIEKLTEREIIDARFYKKNIKELLITKNTNFNVNTKMISVLLKELPIREFIPNEKIRKALEKAYKLLNIKSTPKPVDLNKWFDTIKKRKKKDGKEYLGYIITNAKIIIPNE